MTTLEDLLATAAPRETLVSVCARGDLVALHDDLTEQLAGGSGAPTLAGEPELVAIAERIGEVEAEIDASSLTFRLRGLSRKAWADLLAKHPPTRDQLKRGLDNNELAFPQAAIAATVVEPELSVAKSEQLAESLPMGEWMKLWTATLGLNLGSLQTPKSAAAAAVRRMNDESLATPPTEASLAASSSDEPAAP